MGVLSIFDREDLKAVYELVMEKYQDEIPEGFDKMLWGDLIIMFNQGDTADFWDEQLNWKIISWKLHSSSGVHTIMTSNGLVIHMLVENRYPLTKEVLSQLLDLKLETEEESTMALELIKFVKQQLEEFEDSDDDDLAKSDHEEAERDLVEQRIAAIDGLKKKMWGMSRNERFRVLFIIEVVDGVVTCCDCFGQKGGDVAQFGAKEGKIFVVSAE
ncbi:hypothetical protein Tco_0489757 [Tanacetum coccineum]